MSCRSCLQWGNFSHHSVYHPWCWSERLPKRPWEKVPHSGIPLNPLPEKVLDSRVHWGSAENAVRSGGAGVHSQYPGGKENKIRLTTSLYSTNYTAEAEALKAVAGHIEVSTHASPNVVLLTDTLSVLQALQSNRDTELNDLSAALASLCRGHAVTLQWIPSHCNVPDNKTARKAQQRSKWIGPPATQRWRPSSRPSNTGSGGMSTHCTTGLTPTTC